LLVQCSVVVENYDGTLPYQPMGFAIAPRLGELIIMPYWCRDTEWTVVVYKVVHYPTDQGEMPRIILYCREVF
jgi:hypothetical protein